MALLDRSRQDTPPVLDDAEAALAMAAQRCIMAALDHSRATSIALIDEDDPAGGPHIKLPPKALRVVAEVLGAMGERRPVMLLPQKHELSTIEAASFLNVSRPFVIKEMEAGKLRYRKVGTHRRIEYEELLAYRQRMQQTQDDALQALADEAQDLGLDG